MQIWTKKFPHVTLVFLVLLWAGSLAAQQRGAALGNVPETASGHPSQLIEPFGVALTPPIYLINFLFLYFSNPEIAVYMPAYSAAPPPEVYDCLWQNPDGCPYADLEPYFDEQVFDRGASRSTKSFWPRSCRTDRRWQRLAPREYRHTDQINKPLRMRKARRLARRLGIDDDMILTNSEYQCLIGTPPRDFSREIIYLCTQDLTNSKGNADTPLSSYGLSLNDQGDVRSDCAPRAPCLVFNDLLLGPVEEIAIECGFADKLARLVAETPFLQFAQEGAACQDEWMPSCIVEAKCLRKGRQTNSCQGSLATE